MTTTRLSPLGSPTSDNSSEVQDTITGELYRNISSDGEALSDDRYWFENYLDIRPTADAPATSMKLPQLLILIARFMIGANTANMSPPVNLEQPLGSAVDWGLVNPGIIFGSELYKTFTRYWLDTVNIWRNEGYGNAGKGFLFFTLKVLAASVPSILIGAGVGALLSYYGVTFSTPLARIIAACISPWIYVGTKKLIDYYFPPQEYQASNAPPLHPAQLVAMLGFNILDAVNIYEFVRILISTYGPEELLHHPHFALGVVPLYLLLSNLIDPFAFGHSPLYGPPPFAVHVTHEDIGEEVERPAAPTFIPDQAEFVIPVTDLDVDIAAAERAEARNDKIKNGVVYAACATLAFGAGIAADAVASRVLGDTTTVSKSARKLGVALTCATTAVTQVALVNAAPWVINKTKSCWASFFNNNNHAPDNMATADPLLAPAFAPPL